MTSDDIERHRMTSNAQEGTLTLQACGETRPVDASRRPAVAAGIGLLVVVLCLGGGIASGRAAWNHGFGSAQDRLETSLLWLLVALLMRLTWICAVAALMCWREAETILTQRPEPGAVPRKVSAGPAARTFFTAATILVGTTTAQAAPLPAENEPGHPVQLTAPALDDLPRPTFSSPDPAPAAPTPAFRSEERPPHEASPDTHTVRPGDTLWGLAQAGLPAGAPPARIASALAAWLDANPHLENPDLIEVGDVLNVPDLDAKGLHP